MSNAKKEETSTYFSGNKFFIVHEFNKDLRDGMLIPLTNKVEELIKQKEAVLEIHVNSRGGEGYVAWHIIHLMERAKANGVTVRTIAYEYAYSAGSMVAVAGSKGERYISRTAEHCVHYGHQYGWTESTPLQIDRNTSEKKRWFAKLKAHYEQNCHIPNLTEQLKDDSFFIPANKAIKWGLADKYLDELK